MSVDVTRIQLVLGMTGDPTFDTARATDLLDQAQKIIEPVTGNPIPDSADPVFISCVVRAYLNPTGATQLGAGPFTAAFPAGGIYLTKAERGALRRAMGEGNHFAVEMLPQPFRAAP